MKAKWNPWPWALTAWFAFLIWLCIWFVIKSMGMNHDLVSSTYYADALNHDRHRIAIARTRDLENPPRIVLDTSRHLVVVFLPDFAKDAVLKLYRPSDSRLDLKYALRDGGMPSGIPYQDLHPGKWQAKISWHYQDKDYYFQEDLFIP